MFMCHTKMFFVLLITTAMVPSVIGAEPPSAIVVILKPGESKGVNVVWDDVTISRAAFLWVTPKARVSDRKEVDGKQETSANNIRLAIEKKETERLQALMPPSEREGSYMTVAAVLKVTAESDAKPGITKLYARWGGGQGADDLCSVEIRVLIEDR